MKSFKAILILLIVLIASISSLKRRNTRRNTRRSTRSTRRLGRDNKIEKLSSIMNDSTKVMAAKKQSYTELAKATKASCKKHCGMASVLSITYACLSADCFICKCVVSYAYSKHGGEWDEKRIPQDHLKGEVHSGDCYKVDL